MATITTAGIAMGNKYDTKMIKSYEIAKIKTLSDLKNSKSLYIYMEQLWQEGKLQSNESKNRFNSIIDEFTSKQKSNILKVIKQLANKDVKLYAVILS